MGLETLDAGYWTKWLLDEMAIGRSGYGRSGFRRNGHGRNGNGLEGKVTFLSFIVQLSALSWSDNSRAS